MLAVDSHIDRNTDMKTIQWDRIRISGGNETIVQRLQRKCQNEEIIDRWAPVLMRMELDNLLWRDDEHISIKDFGNICVPIVIFRVWRM